MSLMLLKDALFVKYESRTQQLQSALCMLGVAFVLGLVAWWFLRLGFHGFHDGLEYARQHADDMRQHSFTGRRPRRMGPMNWATYMGFGAGGLLSILVLLLGISGAFHLLRWFGGAGVRK